ARCAHAAGVTRPPETGGPNSVVSREGCRPGLLPPRVPRPCAGERSAGAQALPRKDFPMRQGLVVAVLTSVSCVFCAAPRPARAQDAGSSSRFEWQAAAPESQGMSRKKLDALKDELARRKTRAFLVIRNDKLVY